MKTPSTRHASRLVVLLLALAALTAACTDPSTGGAGASPGAGDPAAPASGDPAPGGKYEYGS
jgi:hypothetical protein